MDIDLMASEVGASYADAHTKMFCMGQTRNEDHYRQCYQRTNQLISRYFLKILTIGQEMALQEPDSFQDPSYISDK